MYIYILKRFVANNSGKLMSLGTQPVDALDESLVSGWISSSKARAATEDEEDQYIEDHPSNGGGSGSDGKSAYEIAVDNGFVGSEVEWLASLSGNPGDPGNDGDPGKSAYEIAVENGFVGDEKEWLTSLHGAPGEDGAPGAAGGAFGYSADKPYDTPDSMDDEFDEGSLNARWSSQGAASTMGFTIPSIMSINTPGESTNVGAIIQAVSDVDQTYIIKVIPSKVSDGNCIGFSVRSGSNRWDDFSYVNDNLKHHQRFANNSVYQELTPVTGFFGASGLSRPFYMRMKYTSSGKGLEWSTSFDCISWRIVETGITTILGDAITHIGIYTRGPGGAPHSVDWFRKLQGSYVGG